jgi:hypothetical protein
MVKGLPCRLILGTTSPMADGACDCDFAILELTRGVLDEIGRRVRAAKAACAECSDLWEASFWHFPCPSYFASSDCEAAAPDDDWQTNVERNGWAILPAAFDLGDAMPQRTELDQIIVRMDHGPERVQVRPEIAWCATPKHTGLTISTKAVRFADLQNLVEMVATG